MPGDLQLDFAAERLRVEELWRSIQDHYAALAVAAARAVHQAEPTHAGLISRDDYHFALDIAATAFSRLIPIYGIGSDGLRLKLSPIDLRTQRFVGGATKILSSDGSSIENLSVLRSDAVSATPTIIRAGLAYMR